MNGPRVCPECGSQRVLPVVGGDIGGTVGDLTILGVVHPRGSSSIEGGDLLWTCADCDAALLDESQASVEDLRYWQDTVDRIFTSYVPLTDEQLDWFNGRRLLKSFARNHHAEELIIVRAQHGFSMHIRSGERTELIRHEVLNDDRYRQIRSFATRSMEKPGDNTTFQLRIGREELLYTVACEPGQHGLNIIARRTA